jgi:hypothetical protein
MPEFPSVEWFDAVGRAVPEGVFRSLGTCDTEFAVQVADRFFELTFAAFDYDGAAEVDEDRAWELDFVLVQDSAAWRDMIENIRSEGRANLHYTLNSIDLMSEAEFARSHDYLRRDKFYRFNQTLQAYFDASSHVETKFALPA